jgi:hypothetical protein
LGLGTSSLLRLLLWGAGPGADLKAKSDVEKSADLDDIDGWLMLGVSEAAEGERFFRPACFADSASFLPETNAESLG